MRKYRQWSLQEEAYLRINHGYVSYNEIANTLGRPAWAVRQKARKLDLPLLYTGPERRKHKATVLTLPEESLAAFTQEYSE